MKNIYKIFLFSVFLSIRIVPQTVQFPKPLSERIANYNINVSLYEQEHKLIGNEILTWGNTSADTITELRFHLYLNAFKNNRSIFMIESGGAHRGFKKKENVWGRCKINSMKIINGQNKIYSTGRYKSLR